MACIQLSCVVGLKWDYRVRSSFTMQGTNSVIKILSVVAHQAAYREEQHTRPVLMYCRVSYEGFCKVGLSDHFTCQGQTITTCNQIHLFQGNVPPELSQLHQFTVQQVQKRSNSCYDYQITSLVKDRLSLRAVKYVYSKATYLLKMSQSHQFTVQQVGKRSNSC